MKKRKIAMMTAIAMLAFSCMGCGDNQSNSTESADSQNESTESTTESVTDEKEVETDVYSLTKDDLEGRSITLTTAEDWWNDTYQELIDAYCDEFGVSIEVNILPAETASEVIKSQFATGELADITMNSASPSEGK